MNEEKQAKEIDLLKLLFVCLHNWWIIALAAIICAAAGFVGTKVLVTPTYSASAQIYVNNSAAGNTDKSSITTSDIAAAQNLVDTYCVILESRLTLEEVIARGNLNYTYKQLDNMISVSSVNKTEVFSVKVTSTDPNEALRIADLIVEVLPDRIGAIIENTSTKPVSPAYLPTASDSTGLGRNTVIGFLIGAAIAAGILILISIFNDTLESDEWLRTRFGEEIPVLAVIPDTDAFTGQHYGKYGKYKKYGYGYGYRKYARYGDYGKEDGTTSSAEAKKD